VRHGPFVQTHPVELLSTGGSATPGARGWRSGYPPSSSTRPVTKSSIQRGTCPIIHRLTVATTRTATRLKSSTLPETSTPSVEKTGSTFSFRPKRWNAIGIIRMDEITCAHRRPIPCTRRIPYTASHWEAPHDAPAAPLRVECRGPIATGHVGDSGSKEHAATIPSTCFDARDRNVRRDHFSFFVISIYDGQPGRCTHKVTELMIAD
jgi:hypothetical protein